MIEPLERIDELTPAWLTEALATATDGATVVGAEATPVGTGQVADSARVALAWDRPGAGPSSVVAKVTAASTTSRTIAAIVRTYEIEVGFYTEIASTITVNAPRCYWAGHDATSNRYTVVLEDVAPAQQGDQIQGCTVDEAAAALEELARLHAGRWGDETLSEIGWLNRRTPEAVSMLGVLLDSSLPTFLERYGARLQPEVVELTERFFPQIGQYLDGEPAPPTIVHSDFRNDNLMFGGPRVWVLDWQTASLGDATSDLSYFLGGSLLPDLRRAHERELVAAYRGALAAQGVDLGAEALWDGYRRHAFSGLIMAVLASTNVEQTDRGDDMFVAMADRAGHHVLDLESEAAIGLPATS